MRFRLGKRQRATEPGVTVLGQQLARAIDAEERHRSTAGDAQSPLDGVAYDVEGGALDMHRFAESPADALLAAFVAAVREMSADELARVRSALRMDDLYTLLAFVRRTALASISGRPQPAVRDGVCALVLIEQDRVDWRDLADAGELLAWSMSKAGRDHRTELSAVAAALRIRLQPSVQALADRAASELGPSRRLIQTPSGPAFAETYGRRYRPDVDLVRLAFAVQDAIEADAYRVRGLTVEADLPAVWLSPRDDPTVSRALETVVAGVSLTGALDPAVSEAAEDQDLWVFLVEAADDDDASVLAAAAVPAKSHQALGIAVGRVCCVVVARSGMDGVRPYERPGALTRFAAPLTAALET